MVTLPSPANSTKTSHKDYHRLWELDALRGIAFILMATYHALFFLVYLGILELPVSEGPLRWIGRIAAAIFIILVGSSGYLSYVRTATKLTPEAITLKFLKRGAFIFSCGLVVTLATVLTIPEFPVIFGILHFIGVSVLLTRFIVLFSKKWLVITGAVVWCLGSWLNTLESPKSTWLVFGIKPIGFASLDYYPILPWFGLVILGVLLGKVWYAEGSRQGFLKKFSTDLPNQEPILLRTIKPLEVIGQHSLLLYLLHIPVFFAIIWILGIWRL